MGKEGKQVNTGENIRKHGKTGKYRGECKKTGENIGNSGIQWKRRKTWESIVKHGKAQENMGKHRKNGENMESIRKHGKNIEKQGKR